MSDIGPYELVRVKDNPQAYEYLAVAYLNWVHGPNCDTEYNNMFQIGNEQRHLTFMRDDSIGDPKDPENEIPNVQEISAPVGTDVFFPVFYFHSSIGESDGQKGTCKTIGECIEAANFDLNLILIENGKKMIYAKISINGEEEVDITSNFDDHDVTVPQFTMTVGENLLNREPQFHLPPGTHEGAVRGTFMYMRNFKKGEYILKFGGTSTVFNTNSVYTMHVD